MPYANADDQKRAAKAHYEANKVLYKARAVAHGAKNAAAIKEFLREYLLTHPCVDCGETDIIVLEFDHRPGTTKRFNIGAHGQRNFSLSSVREEVGKCDVRCANCHRRATYKRAGRTHRG